MRDPGWKASRNAVGKMFSGKAPLKNEPVLVALRAIIFISLAWWIVSFGLLWALDLPGDGAWWPAILVPLAGLGALFYARGTLVKTLAADTVEALATQYRGRCASLFAIANGVVALGFISAFVSGRGWVFLVALPFAIALLVMCAPTRDAVEQAQRRLARSGSELSLLEALMMKGADLRPHP